MRAPAVTDAETQPPHLVGQRTEQVGVHVALAYYRKTLGREYLAEARGGVKLVSDVLHTLDGIIKNVALVIGGGIVVIVLNITGKALHMPVGPAPLRIGFHEVRVENGRATERAEKATAKPFRGEHILRRESPGPHPAQTEVSRTLDHTRAASNGFVRVEIARVGHAAVLHGKHVTEFPSAPHTLTPSSTPHNQRANGRQRVVDDVARQIFLAERDVQPANARVELPGAAPQF